MTYKVTVYVSQEIEVEADSQEDAEKIATEQTPFPWVDYCESELIGEL